MAKKVYSSIEDKLRSTTEGAFKDSQANSKTREKAVATQQNLQNEGEKERALSPETVGTSTLRQEHLAEFINVNALNRGKQDHQLGTTLSGVELHREATMEFFERQLEKDIEAAYAEKLRHKLEKRRVKEQKAKKAKREKDQSLSPPPHHPGKQLGVDLPGAGDVRAYINQL